MTRLTLSGYYGYGNAGDEAVLAGLVKGFRDARPDGGLELIALSGSPAETEAMHGIGAAHRYQAGPLLRAVAHTDALLSGGGSLLQDVTSAHSLFYYLGVVRLAQMLGKPTMFIAQGIGPLRLPRSRRLVASVANRLNAITVRDSDSANLLREIGVKKPTTEVTADPALLLSLSPDAWQKEDLAAVALRPWFGADGLVDVLIAACLPTLADTRLLLVPMQPGTDKVIAEQFGRKWHQVARASATLLPLGLPLLGHVPDPIPLENFAACQIVIGMRLHALILAAACGVPSVALSYDPKVEAFMQSSGQGDAVYDLTKSDPAALTALIGRVWTERAARARALRAALPSLRAQAARNVSVALELTR